MEEEKEVAPEKDVTEAEGDEKDKEIDIYLFSNGQQYSPPRKYHIRASELKYWDTTLSYLARSQYGSLHSAIDLHELDGVKVEDPAMIRDCAVYVAVVPPDPFIYAGYDKYLVKASRSFERRFSKRINGPETSSPDDRKNSINVPIRDQNSKHVIDNELQPQYPSSRKSSDIRKSSVKLSSQKLLDKIKPVANQVSQRLSVPRNSANISDLTAKKVYSSKRDTSRNRSRISTLPTIPGRSSTLVRDASLNKSLSPSKQAGLDAHRTSGGNQNPLHLARDRSSAKIQDVMKDLQKVSNVMTVDTDNTASRNSKVAETPKETAPNNKIQKPQISSVSDVKKPTVKEIVSAINKTQNSAKDEKLQYNSKDRISVTNHIRNLTQDKRSELVPPTVAKQILDLKDKKQIVTTELDKSYNMKTPAVEEILKSDKDRFSVISEEVTIEDIPITIENNEKQIITDSTPYPGVPLSTKTDKTSLMKTKKSAVGELSQTKKRNVIDQSKVTIDKNIPNKKVKDIFVASASKNPIVIDEVLDNKSKVILDPNQNLTLKPNQSKKTFNGIPSLVENIPEPNGNNTFSKKIKTFPLKLDQPINTTDTAPNALINGIKVSPVEATHQPQYNDVVVEMKDDNGNSKVSTQQRNINKQNNDEELDLDSKVNYNGKAPLLFHLPEKSIKYISTIGMSSIQNKGDINNNIYSKNSFRPVDCDDVIIKFEDIDVTKTHSLTLYISKDDNGLKINDTKANLGDQEAVNIPITEIVKDKDIVHVNIYRNSISEVTLNSVDTDDTLYKPQQYKEKTKSPNIDSKYVFSGGEGSAVNNKVKTLLDSSRHNYAPEIVTTFVNPTQDVQSTSNVPKPPSNDKYVINSENVPDKNQSVAIVQKGDVTDLKVKIQVKNADGVLKTSQLIETRKSNSVTKLENDEIGKTPNELTRSKSLQSIENDSPPHLCCQKEKKVVVYQCACCSPSGIENTNFALGANLLNPDLQGLYVLLPVVAQPVRGSIRSPNQTSDKQVQHTESLTKMNIVNIVKETLAALPGDGDKHNLSNICCPLEKISNSILTDKGCERLECSSKRQVSIVSEEIIHSEVIIVKTDHSQTSSQANTENKKLQTTARTQDQTTQTDWCDVLLEARAEADGHYTFYLPPLQLLQQYSQIK